MTAIRAERLLRETIRCTCEYQFGQDFYFLSFWSANFARLANREQNLL
jgi:hypothetical protein